MSDPIKFYFDFLSPYSYLAWTQREAIEARTGRQIDMIPVDILAVMETVGNTPTTITCPAKGKYAGTDLQRWIKRYQVPFQTHPHFGSFPSAPLHLSVLSAGERSQRDTMIATGFHAVWRDQLDMASDDAIVRYLKDSGIADAAGLWARKDGAREMLAKNNAAAISDGVFGVPSFVVDDSLYFGNDRLEFLTEEHAA